MYSCSCVQPERSGREHWAWSSNVYACTFQLIAFTMWKRGGGLFRLQYYLEILKSTVKFLMLSDSCSWIWKSLVDGFGLVTNVFFFNKFPEFFNFSDEKLIIFVVLSSLHPTKSRWRVAAFFFISEIHAQISNIFTNLT